MPDITLHVLTARPGERARGPIHLDAATPRQALSQADLDPGMFRPQSGALALGVVAFRNGQDIRHSGGMDAELAPGDCLQLVTPATDS